ncbi:MAG: hypothetical protein ACRC14_07465 [Paracoccaceae bacterium]
MPSPNALAYLMICLWPLIAWGLWTRLDAGRALIWTVLGGYLLLPPLTAINLPAVPDLDKSSIPNLAALALAWLVSKDQIGFDPGNWIGRALIAMFVLSPFATVLTNGEPIQIEAGDIQGMTIYDSVAAVANQAIVILPFFLARHYLATPEAMRTILVALMLAGFAYSVPMLIETQLSPQMNVWFYGFFQHDFFQTIRTSGYRPVVFLPHGLWVAFFALMCLVAAMVLWRHAKPEERPKYILACGYLALLLVACKSAGPMLYALAVAPVVLILPRRWQFGIAAVLAIVVVAYPLLRGAHVVPVDRMVAIAMEINPARGESLAFRIDNEERLLDHAAQKPLFGWGGYNRNMLHDPVTGRVLTIADGAWIIVLGIYGWLGYIAEFGLIALPLVLLGREAFLGGRVFSPHAAAVAMLLAVNMVDMLPNATKIPFTFLMAGALMGHAQMLRTERLQGARAVREQRFHRAHSGKTVI